MIAGGCLSGAGLIAASFCNTVEGLYFFVGVVGGEFVLNPHMNDIKFNSILYMVKILIEDVFILFLCLNDRFGACIQSQPRPYYDWEILLQKEAHCKWHCHGW